MHAPTTYRDDARDKEGLVATLKEITKHKHIRFSGRDEDLSVQHWCLDVNLFHMDRQNLETPEAWRAYKVLDDVFRKIDAQVKQIKEDAESIERILSGHGYERLIISDDQTTAHVYVRHLGSYVDVLTDQDPYTRRWKLGYHQIAHENFDGWCDIVFDAKNTWYHSAMDKAYRVRYSLGASIGGLAIDAALASIVAAVFVLGGDTLLAEASVFSIMGVRGMRRVAKSYHQTRPEPQITFAQTRLVDGKKALVYAIDPSKLK